MTEDDGSWSRIYRSEIENRRFTGELRHLFENGTPSMAEIGGLLQNPSTAVLSGALLDHTTFELARAFMVSGPEAQSDLTRLRAHGLSSVTHAVSSVIEAIVIHDRILVGEGHQITFSDSNGSASLVRESLGPDARLDDRSRFWLMSAARRQALHLASDEEVIGALCAALGGAIDAPSLNATLERLTVRQLGPSLLNRITYRRPTRGEREDAIRSYVSGDLRGRIDQAEWRLDLSDFQARGIHRASPPEQVRGIYAGLALSRAVFYMLLADRNRCVYRSDALRGSIPGIAGNVAFLKSFRIAILREVDRMERIRDDEINEALRFEALPVPMPLIANAVIQRSATRWDCLRIALDVRESREGRRFRKFCQHVEVAINEGDRRGLENAVSDLRRYGITLVDAVGRRESEIVTGANELLSYASPLASALFSFFRIPATQILDQLGNRRFALLSEARNSQRGEAARNQMLLLWSTLTDE